MKFCPGRRIPKLTPPHIRLWPVISKSYVTQQVWLHAVDRTKEHAEVHAEMVREEYERKAERARVWVDDFESDHLFAAGFLLWSAIKKGL